MSIRQQFLELKHYMTSKIIGQSSVIDIFIIGLVSGGHILIEGVPGVAKTRAATALASCLKAQFKRVQFTSDLLPSDLTGHEVYRPTEGKFVFFRGPIFSNIILADEFNRSPAKVQSALLESMAEGQVSVSGHTFSLPEFFMVLATQNSNDQEGTYALSCAQLDRFLLNVKVDYPQADHEKQILQMTRKEALQSSKFSPTVEIQQSDLFIAKKEVLSIYMSDSVENYIIRLIDATRKPVSGMNVAKMLQNGVSSRGTQALDRASRAHAWLHKRNFVSPLDVKTVAASVLQHRIKLSMEAISKQITTDLVIKELLEKTVVT